MSPILKFLASARSLASQGFKKEQIYEFAQREFGEINELMQKQIENIFKPQKPTISKNKFFDPKDPLPYYNETPGEFARRETPGSKENLLQELKIAYGKEFDRLRGDETAEELKEILKNLDTDGVPFASGGRAGYYGGGQAMVGEDLSEIGHGADALMARNMQLAPNGQATTSTGLNYLLGQDNETVRVPYVKGKLVKGAVDKGRRGFMKAAGAAGAGIAALKTGLLGFADKAAPVVEKVAEAAPQVPAYFLNLVQKIKNLGTDVTQVLAYKDRQKVTKYKDFELTEDLTTGRQEIQRMKVLDDADAADYYGQPLTEETYMSFKPGKGQIDETTKGKTPPDEYEEGTALLRSDRQYAGEVVEEIDGVADDVIEEGTKFEDNLSEFGKAEGGRIGYSKGKIVKEGIPALINKIKSLFGDDAITTADKIPTPQKTLDRDMFKNFDDRNPEMQTLRDGKTKSIIPKNEYAEYSKDFNKEILNIPVQQEGKFTKAEYLIQRLENTIKGNPKDKYVQDTFPGFIDELKANPDLAKNENVFKELGGDLPEGQQIVVYGDDSVDFFTQKSGPGNIDRLKKLMAKHNISREKALKIMKMEPSDQVMEFKMLEVANRKLHAEGGRIGLFLGGGLKAGKALTKEMLKFMSKDSANAKSPAGILKMMNPKQFEKLLDNPKYTGKISPATGETADQMILDMIKKTKDDRSNMVGDLIGSARKIKKVDDDIIAYKEKIIKDMIAKGINENEARGFADLMAKEMKEAAAPQLTSSPPKVTEQGLLELENIQKNLLTRDRQLQASGGLATMLGE